ncbi:sepB protein [Hortaea werneckii]|nr:sepB protein [Hortaea werneckii]
METTWDTVQPRAADLLKEDSKGSFLLTRQKANRRLPKLAMACDPSLENIFDRDQRGGLARLPTLAEPSRLWLGAPVLDTLAAIIPTGPTPLRLGPSRGDGGGSKVLGLLTLRGFGLHSQLYCWFVETTKLFNGWVLIYVVDVELLRSDGEDSHRFGRGATIYLPDSGDDVCIVPRERQQGTHARQRVSPDKRNAGLRSLDRELNLREGLAFGLTRCVTRQYENGKFFRSALKDQSVQYRWEELEFLKQRVENKRQCSLWKLCHGSWAPIGSPAHKTFDAQKSKWYKERKALLSCHLGWLRVPENIPMLTIIVTSSIFPDRSRINVAISRAFMPLSSPSLHSAANRRVGILEPSVGRRLCRHPLRSHLKWTWKVWVFFPALEDDAMELVACYSHRPVVFFFLAALQSFKCLRVQQRYPLSLAGCTPLDAFWKRKDIFALMYLVPFDIFDGIKQASCTLAAYRAIPDSHHIVSPASAGDCWRAFLAPVDVVTTMHESDSDMLVTSSPEGRGVRQSVLVVHVSCGFVVFEWVGEVEIAMFLSVIELHSNRMVRFLIDRPHEASQVQTEIASIASPGRASRLKRLCPSCSFAEPIGLFSIARAIIIFDEAGAIFRHRVRAKKIVEIIIFSGHCSSAPVALPIVVGVRKHVICWMPANRQDRILHVVESLDKALCTDIGSMSARESFLALPITPCHNLNI